ncbi:FAD-dependent oxidoreductase [Rhodopila sp.]|uniref:FAD-dependent oxidoreductase n=1 Tax=Rhodopila sp. TaxID=2480087 RepID=UPI003D117792
MAEPEHFDILILGSGQGGKLLAWHMGRAGKRVAVVERRWVGGSCPAVACLPSKNELWSARVAHLVASADQFGIVTDRPRTDMSKVRRRKQGASRTWSTARTHFTSMPTRKAARS